MGWEQVLTIIVGTSSIVGAIITLAVSLINKRFEDMNKRFEDMNRRIDSLERRMESELKEIKFLLYKFLEVPHKEE